MYHGRLARGIPGRPRARRPWYEMSNPPPQIEYSQPIPWHRRRRIQRAIVVGVIAIGLSVGGYLWGPAVWRQAQLLYWQRQCMAFDRGQPTTVYDSAAKVMDIAECWTNFNAAYSPPGMISHGTILVHEMRNPQGEVRLVGIDAIGSHFPAQPDISVRVFVPGNLLRPPRQQRMILQSPGRAFPAPQDSTFQLTSGTVDPRDLSHAWFTYVKDGETKVIDVWLGNDDDVTLEKRESPTAPPPASRE